MPARHHGGGKLGPTPSHSNKSSVTREKGDTNYPNQELEGINTDLIDTWMTLRKYYKQLYAHKFDNSNKMVTFLEKGTIQNMKNVF